MLQFWSGGILANDFIGDGIYIYMYIYIYMDDDVSMLGGIWAMIYSVMVKYG